MCVTCGCSDGATATISDGDHDIGPTGASGDAPAHGDHSHGHDDVHSPSHAHAKGTAYEFDDLHARAHALGLPHDHAPRIRELAELGSKAPRTITLERAILAKNDALAERNRAWFAARRIVALNLVSSPGSGKTTLLERTVAELGGEIPFYVIEGDQATANDARRIRAAGATAIQVNTGTGCHLEADMIARALAQLDPVERSVVVIENVGNLVCPALFDLGERCKVAILSVTEGADKPEKYPHMFAAANVMLLNKIDLLPYVDFDVESCRRAAERSHPGIRTISLSARTGEAMDRWYAWLRAEREG